MARHTATGWHFSTFDAVLLDGVRRYVVEKGTLPTGAKLHAFLGLGDGVTVRKVQVNLSRLADAGRLTQVEHHGRNGVALAHAYEPLAGRGGTP